MRIKRFQSLSFKLTVWYIIILGTTVILAGMFLHQGFKHRLMDDLDQVLLEIADGTYEIWYKRKGVSWEDAIKKAEVKYSNHRPFLQIVTLTDGRKKEVEKIIRSDQIPESSFICETSLYYKADRSDIDDLVYSQFYDENLDSYSVRVILYPIRGPYIIQVGVSLEDTTQALNQLSLAMVLAGLILLLLASFGGSLIINKALRPVKSAVKTANEITADDLSLRIDAKNRRDEIGALVETFNNMIARLEKSVRKIRQFSGDVSHELRTPLTIIRGEIEVLIRKDRKKEDYLKTLESVLEESGRMEKIIDDLLFLSRVEALGRSKLNEIVPLDEVLKQVLNNRKHSAKSKKIELKADKISPVQVKGNRDLLERMIANLIDNAVRYTPSKGKVDVILDKNQNVVQLEIHDTGIGIPEESLASIFDRFYVVDKSRSKETGGSGLGLSIVKWIADNHSAKIDVRSQVDKGSIFIIRFPKI